MSRCDPPTQVDVECECSHASTQTFGLSDEIEVLEGSVTLFMQHPEMFCSTTVTVYLPFRDFFAYDWAFLHGTMFMQQSPAGHIILHTYSHISPSSNLENG